MLCALHRRRRPAPVGEVRSVSLLCSADLARHRTAPGDGGGKALAPFGSSIPEWTECFVSRLSRSSLNYLPHAPSGCWTREVVATNAVSTGAPGGTRTPDPQVRSRGRSRRSGMFRARWTPPSGTRSPPGSTANPLEAAAAALAALSAGVAAVRSGGAAARDAAPTRAQRIGRARRRDSGARGVPSRAGARRAGEAARSPAPHERRARRRARQAARRQRRRRAARSARGAAAARRSRREDRRRRCSSACAARGAAATPSAVRGILREAIAREAAPRRVRHAGSRSRRSRTSCSCWA